MKTPAMLLALVAGAASLAHAQPTLTGLAPGRNAQHVPNGSALTATFSQTLAGASAAGLRVFSSQQGGQRAGHSGAVLVSSNQLTFQPTRPWQPGETVQATLTAGIGSGGGPLATPGVVAFTAAAGGSGRGSFTPRGAAITGCYPDVVRLADLDGDGDLDLASSNFGSASVSVRFNNGQGEFGGNTELVMAHGTNGTDHLTVGDVDGDGDLDLLATDLKDTVSVRLNDGQGSFGARTKLPVGTQVLTDLALADLDADGDLDMLAYGYTSVNYTGLLQMRLNNGSGQFGPGVNTLFSTAAGNEGGLLRLADLDRDGDLDLVRSSRNGGRLFLHFNTGDASFGDGIQLPDYTTAGFLLSDVNHDGAPDLLLLKAAGPAGSQSVVSIYQHNGGTTASSVAFALSATLAPANVLGGPLSCALADLNADGLADLLLQTNYRLYALPATSPGSFGTAAAVAATPLSTFTTGDVDGDGDLDLLATDQSASPPGGSCAVSCFLNEPATGLATSNSLAAQLLLYPNPAAQQCTLVLPPGTQATAVTVLNVLGQVVRAWPAAAGTSRLVLPLADLAPGLYTLQVSTGAGRLTRQLVKE